MRARTQKLPAQLSDVHPEHLACRDFGHAWSPFRAEWRQSERAYFVQLRCGRCGTLRVRTLDRYGQQINNHYEYAEHYLIKGAGRMTGATRDALRLASVQRLINLTPTEEETQAS